MWHMGSSFIDMGKWYHFRVCNFFSPLQKEGIKKQWTWDSEGVTRPMSHVYQSLCHFSHALSLAHIRP